jgi:hypothetical protein
MKKQIITLMAILTTALTVWAGYMPYYSNSIPNQALGVYQVTDTLTIYDVPDDKAKEVFVLNINYKDMQEGVFAAFVPEKNLSFLYVTDVGDGWVEVIYDKDKNLRGWVKLEDKFLFSSWLTFYNMYGRKYGLKLMKDLPEVHKVLKSAPEDDAQVVSRINYPQVIKLTALRGNWALVSVLDMDKTPKTGFLKWRDSNGAIYAFPEIK